MCKLAATARQTFLEKTGSFGGSESDSETTVESFTAQLGDHSARAKKSGHILAWKSGLFQGKADAKLLVLGYIFPKSLNVWSRSVI